MDTGPSVVVAGCDLMFHAYETIVLSDGAGATTLQIFDPADSTDNSGSLSVQIYRLLD